MAFPVYIRKIYKMVDMAVGISTAYYLAKCNYHMFRIMYRFGKEVFILDTTGAERKTVH